MLTGSARAESGGEYANIGAIRFEALSNGVEIGAAHLDGIGDVAERLLLANASRPSQNCQA